MARAESRACRLLRVARIRQRRQDAAGDAEDYREDASCHRRIGRFRDSGADVLSARPCVSKSRARPGAATALRRRHPSDRRAGRTRHCAARRISRQQQSSGSSRSIEPQAQPGRSAVGSCGIPYLQQERSDNTTTAEADQPNHVAKSESGAECAGQSSGGGAEFRRDRRCAGGNFRSLAAEGAGCADRDGVQRNWVHHGESAGTESFTACE